jgi:hypothetical protein
MNCFDLDWGEIFVESYNTQTKKATIIYNFNFSAEPLIDDYFNCSVAHLFWINKNLPTKSSINVIYDLRGIRFDHALMEEFKNRVQNHFVTLGTPIQLTINFQK